MDFIDATEREQELRTHIHSLLLQYALTHLATDHVAWTQETVADVRIQLLCNLI